MASENKILEAEDRLVLIKTETPDIEIPNNFMYSSTEENIQDYMDPSMVIGENYVKHEISEDDHVLIKTEPSSITENEIQGMS